LEVIIGDNDNKETVIYLKECVSQPTGSIGQFHCVSVRYGFLMWVVLVYSLRCSDRDRNITSLLECSDEVLELNSSFQPSLSRGGKLFNLGLSFMARWTILPYFEGKQGFSQGNPYESCFEAGFKSGNTGKSLSESEATGIYRSYP